MIRVLIEFSLRQRLLILALTLLLAGAGVYAGATLPIDAFPDLTNNQVNIVTEAPGMAAAEVCDGRRFLRQRARDRRRGHHQEAAAIER